MSQFDWAKTSGLTNHRPSAIGDFQFFSRRRADCFFFFEIWGGGRLIRTCRLERGRHTHSRGYVLFLCSSSSSRLVITPVMLDERDEIFDRHGGHGGGGGGGGADQQGGNMGATVLSLAQGLGLEFVPLSALLFLDARDIAACGAANRFLHKAAGDEGVWRAARDRLWEGKVFVPESTRAMRAKEGYIASLRDSKRTWLDADELTSFSWWFRFKQQAGEAWTAQDPWYRNEKVSGRGRAGGEASDWRSACAARAACKMMTSLSCP